MTASMLDAADECFHARSDHPHWNESAWFGLTLPALDASAYVYFYHRPNMRLSAGGVKVWDPSGSSEYNCLGYDWDRTQALPDGADMFGFTLANGLSVEMLEPFGAFAIRHRGAFEADLEWRRYTDPYAFGPNTGLEGWTTADGGHYQQFGSMTGEIRIPGRDPIAVDTTAIRDRSWGPRRAVTARPAELMWCCAPGGRNAFSVYSVEDTVAFGWYVRDGVGAHVTGGTSRVLERGADLRPLRMQLDVTDDQGRRLQAEGRAVNALVWSVYDRTYQLPCTTWWEFDGVTATGEDWTCLPTETARALLRSA